MGLSRPGLVCFNRHLMARTRLVLGQTLSPGAAVPTAMPLGRSQAGSRGSAGASAPDSLPQLHPEWAPALFYATTLCFGFALLMLTAPGQFVGPAYAWMQPWLGGFALIMACASTLGAGAALGLVPARAYPLVLLGLATPLFALAVGFARIGLVGGPILYGTDAFVLTWMAIVLARGGQPIQPRPLLLTVGIGQLAQGLAMLIFVEQYAGPLFGSFPAYRVPIAVCWIATGGALLLSQLRPPGRWFVIAGVVAAFNYALYASFFVPTRGWTGVVAYASVVPFLLLSQPTALSWRSATLVFAGLAGTLALAATLVVAPTGVLVSLGLALAVLAVVLATRVPILVSVLLPALAVVCIVVAGTLGPTNAIARAGVLGVALAGWLGASPRWRWSAHLATAIGVGIVGLASIGMLVQIVDLRGVPTSSIPLDFGTNLAILVAGIAVVLASVPSVLSGSIGGRVFAGLGAVLVLVVIRGLISSAGQTAAIDLALTDAAASQLVAAVTLQAMNGLLFLIAAALVITGVVTTRTITHPLASMVRVMERFGAGDLTARLTPAGTDEISRAEVAFNKMADELTSSHLDLQRAQGDLRALNLELEQRVERRTAELVAASKELEAFSYSVSHDLRAPLRAIDGFSAEILKRYDALLDEDGRRYLGFVRDGTLEMGRLIDDLLQLSMFSRSEMRYEHLDLSALAASILADLQRAEPNRAVEVEIQPRLSAIGDRTLVRAALQNLLGNAWKFSAHAGAPHISFGALSEGLPVTYFVRDNGAGFDMAYASKLFTPFQRLHSQHEFPGTGIGLASVSRIVRRHGGIITAHGTVGAGATFQFTLAPTEDSQVEPLAANHTEEMILK
jgi:signal transduction histidine kinase